MCIRDSGETIGIVLREFAIADPNGGVIALTAVSNMRAGTIFLTTLPAEPPIWDPAQSPVPLKMPSRLTLAINFWLLRLVVFLLRRTIISLLKPDISWQIVRLLN